MAVIDGILILILLALSILGLALGFARQVLKLVSGVVGVIISLFLLAPTFNLLLKLDFFNNLISALGEKININISFLAPIAESAGKTQGLLVSEYIFKIIVYIALCLFFGVLLKLLKKLILMFVALPGIKTVDRILGFILGFTWGALIIYTVFLVLFWFKDTSAIGNFLTNTVPDGCLTQKLIISNLENFKDLIVYLFKSLIGAI